MRKLIALAFITGAIAFGQTPVPTSTVTFDRGTGMITAPRGTSISFVPGFYTALDATALRVETRLAAGATKPIVEIRNTSGLWSGTFLNLIDHTATSKFSVDYTGLATGGAIYGTSFVRSGGPYYIGTNPTLIADWTRGTVMALSAGSATSVNYVTVASSATGVWPSLTATGPDSNIGIGLVPKGTGYVGIGSALDPIAPIRAKKKFNTDSRSSNTTVTADSELVIPIGANQTWTFEFHVYVQSSSTTPGWKGGLTFPTSPTNVRWTMDYNDYDALTVSAKGKFTGDSTTTTCTFAGTTNGGEVIMRGQIRNGANAGNITLMYAQAVSNVTSTLNQQQSYANAILVQ